MKVVFVHFGKPIPRYLIENILRTEILFPEIEIVLISDQRCDEIKNKCEILNTVTAQDFTDTEKYLNHPMYFRNKFWMTTYIRLIALARYVEIFEEPILHIESDVLISADFPFQKFFNLTHTVAFPAVSPGFSVASLLFISDRVIAKALLDFLSDELCLNPMTTDMKVLDRFRESNPSKTTILPTGPATGNAFQSTIPLSLLTQMRENFEYFGGFFDAIDIGFYLFGEDPRNNRGFRLVRKIDEQSYLKISSLNFKFNRGRKFINFSHEGCEYSLFSLHIHSKDLRAFGLTSFAKLSANRINSQNKHVVAEFVIRIFLSQLFNYLRNKLKSI